MITYMNQFDWNLIELLPLKGLQVLKACDLPQFFFIDWLCILTTPGLEALGGALLFVSMVSNKLCYTCMPNLSDS